MDRRMSAALDRYITGNWGEDSISDMPPSCENCPEEKYNECEGQFMNTCIEVQLDGHPACCIEHRVEMEWGMCWECQADYYATIDKDLTLAEDRVKLLKVGLTAKYLKRIEKLYLEQERIKIVKNNILKVN